MTTLVPPDAGRQPDEGRQLAVWTSFADDGVADAKTQAQLRRQRVASPSKPLHEIASRRVADPVADVDERAARAAYRNFDRQPEVHHGVNDDVIGGQTAQREHVSIRPRAAVKVICDNINNE